MFEKETTDILLKFLEKKASEAEREIEDKGVLSDDKAIPLLLRTQFNHIAHLDKELTALRKTMNEKFEKIDEKFERMNERFENIDEKFERMNERFGNIDEKFERKLKDFALRPDKKKDN